MTKRRGPKQKNSLFRKEALDHYLRAEHSSDVLRLKSSWTGSLFWLVVAFVAFGLVFLSVARVHEYASGPAVLKAEGQVDLTVASPGIVDSIAVRPGRRVAPGDLLVRLRATDEGPAAGRPTISLRAPHAGVVDEVRVREGQYVSPGDLVASIVREDQGLRLVAMLPGHYRPLLREGQPLRLEVKGYRYAYQTFRIETVGNRVVGPREVRRRLGAEIADGLELRGPVVIVEATVPESTFSADGRELGYHDGMHGQADVRVRSERAGLALVPGLGRLLATGDP